MTAGGEPDLDDENVDAANTIGNRYAKPPPVAVAAADAYGTQSDVGTLVPTCAQSGNAVPYFCAACLFSSKYVARPELSLALKS